MESQNQLRGMQLYKLGRYTEATTYFNQAIVSDSNDITSKYYLILSQINLKDFDKATQLLNGLERDIPNEADVYFLWAQLLFSQENYTLALQKIFEAININPVNDNFFGVKGAILLNLKKYDEALMAVEEGLRIDAKNSYCLNVRAQILTKLDRKDEARSTVENILHDNPEDAYSYTNVGWVELEQGNIKKAQDHFKEALRFDPNFEYARHGMTTAIKGKNPIYAAYLKYAFWIAKKSSKNQWVFIIGIYLIYRFAFKILSASGLTIIAIPLMLAYLVFALGAWIMEPMSNTILLFDKYGKYLLEKSQKLSGYFFGGLLLFGLVALASYYITQIPYTLILGVTFICLLIPLPRAFIANSSSGKTLGIAYSALMAIIGIAGPLFLEGWTPGVVVFLMMVIYTWIGNFFD
ncbi:tetratricopeptide repeat protein [Flagellimonas onchidii]|uniref:tetratricopeptide repeat protein n=1 Tax=Flagellimonas onchidii TaxID=2562684 RepID=UPI0010A5BE8D|nr:tetratricopeptide repeat protein [Allomuricauda onchidii]